MSTTDSVKTPRRLIGKVVSNKCHQTISVLVERKVKHPVIGKVMVRSKKYHAHDETNEYQVGETVEILETKPYSKTKSWRATRHVDISKASAS